MIEAVGDIWRAHAGGELIGVTTNGTINICGGCVMGRGIALQAKKKFPKLPRMIGDLLTDKGNRVFVFNHLNIFTFPVKHNWWEKADLKLIERSCQQLIEATADRRRVYLVRPGCDNGRRDWDTEVRPIIEKMLPGKRFIIVSKGT
jgi:hypothetical protein